MAGTTSALTKQTSCLRQRRVFVASVACCRSNKVIEFVSRTKARVSVIIDEEVCKGCGLCVSVCPRNALGFTQHLNSRGFHPAVLLKGDDCTACAQCALMCPDACVTILKSE